MNCKLYLESILPFSFAERINAANRALLTLDELLAQSEILLKQSLGLKRDELKQLKRLAMKNRINGTSSFFNATVISGERMIDFGFVTAKVSSIQDIVEYGIPLDCIDLECLNEPNESISKAVRFSGIGKYN
jgi:hypothetical protein